jgi:hypothetical protein
MKRFATFSSVCTGGRFLAAPVARQREAGDAAIDLPEQQLDEL